MGTLVWIAMTIAGVALIVGAYVASRIIGHSRRRALQHQFLSEYDRTVRVTGDRVAAEIELQRRLDRRNVIELHDIDARKRDAIRNDWIAVQAVFVDDPTRALSRAARLVHRAMTEHGYPDEDTDEQIALISVDYPELVPELRRAHLSTLRGRSGSADTEELREAFLRYRAVFDRLIGERASTNASHR
jgi:hypothetical protein